MADDWEHREEAPKEETVVVPEEPAPEVSSPPSEGSAPTPAVFAAPGSLVMGPETVAAPAPAGEPPAENTQVTFEISGSR